MKRMAAAAAVLMATAACREAETVAPRPAPPALAHIVYYIATGPDNRLYVSWTNSTGGSETEILDPHKTSASWKREPFATGKGVGYRLDAKVPPGTPVVLMAQNKERYGGVVVFLFGTGNERESVAREPYGLATVGGMAEVGVRDVNGRPMRDDKDLSEIN